LSDYANPSKPLPEVDIKLAVRGALTEGFPTDIHRQETFFPDQFTKAETARGDGMVDPYQVALGDTCAREPS
jgi:hypothetical protein